MFLDDSFSPSSGGVPAPHESPPISPVTHTFDDLDDVFGSAPSSPNATLSGLPGIEARPNNSRSNVEPSEIPRLRSAHTTAGYRDGVAAAKSTQVQTGFDEGYGLGAVIGLKVGEILGVLEALYAAVNKKNGAGNEAREAPDADATRLLSLVEKAREELTTENVFAREWWGVDGIWKFPVPGEDEGDVTFKDVAAAHPRLRKWDSAVKSEVDRWGLVLGVLEPEEGQTED